MVDRIRRLTDEQEQKPCTDSSSTPVTTDDNIYIYIYQDSSGAMVRQLAPIQLTGCLEKPCSDGGLKHTIVDDVRGANLILENWIKYPRGFDN